MSYIDAGYTIALLVVTGYAASLWQRRRRLEKIVRSMRQATVPASATSVEQPEGSR